MGCTYLSLPLIPASGTEVLIQALWYTLMNWVVWFWKRLLRLRPSHYDFTKGNVSSISPSDANLSDLFSLQNTKYFNQIMYTKMWCANGSHLCCPGLNALTFHCRSCILHWRHSERYGVSNHRRLDCLLNCLFRRRSKKTSKLRATGHCDGNSPVTGEFPAQRTSNAKNVSVWWRHHGEVHLVILVSADRTSPGTVVN